MQTLGDLVKKGTSGGLFCKMILDGKTFSYTFRESVKKVIHKVVNECGSRESNTIFIPEKEVLSICSIIKKSREQDSVFGFDGTYLDLVRAISTPMQKEPSLQSFSEGQRLLRNLIGGTEEYDAARDTWSYMKNRDTGRGKMPIAIGTTAEGVKK